MRPAPRSFLAGLIALIMVIAACGGGESGDETDGTTAPSDASTAASTAGTTGATTSSSTTEATTAVVPTSNDDWCLQSDNQQAFAIPDLGSLTDLRAAGEAYLAAIDDAVAAAPDDIKADMEIIAEAGKQFFQLLADNDYDIFSLDPDDPRLRAFEDEAIGQAANNIAEYCGVDLADPTAGEGSPTVLDGLDEQLLPPGTVTFAEDGGAAGVIMGVDGDFETIVSHYESLTGDSATRPTEDSAFLQSTFEGGILLVTISDGDPIVVSVSQP